MDTIQFLNQKILLLESRLDSIQRMDNLRELNMKLNEQADIISNVGGFYESAWLKLIIVISILGIIIPILIQFFQRNTLKEVTSFLSTEIKETFDLRITELVNSNANQINELTDKVNSEMNLLKTSYECISNELEASLFYLQGKQSYSAKNYGSAMRDYAKSAEFWSKSTKKDRVGVIYSNIGLCAKGLKTKESFNKALIDFDLDWEKFLKQMIANEFHKDKLNEMKKIISSLD
ncbi:MAG TPA: hypothetical protein DCQ26_07710 [Marinilabiliales bacterium]|nr:MAG: hypothetical protein A2W84_08885 [Bacteroidetes bacterium GWC2_40_13]OFX71920.1 MAG: hypothetical protein A2W96_06720 [Bacteroidetes bacterium GWD2_40_43]OFX94717.1 MAG: hypothetical protein A2W97_18525 [Bacteroidetes bacterium GWE2_40_63]OFY24754.1 MAG: hypothetical protein A2W88_16790 [Bacteroidetes bacterium GWF2_40_13]OFZ24481.1 MAG: hypothetical protein A2437_18655 [Bacteroidetes bacterium RIFOXYC2_FULL_40_12]HAM98484.1 hypothetical protein [Marinilabiliales bacterium]